MLRPSPAPGVHRLRVWAVEDSRAQLTWSSLPPGPITFRAADALATVPGGPGPGSADLAPLPPSSRLTLYVSTPGGPARPATRFSTLPAPPGEELCRLATVNDLHVGAHEFGTAKPLQEPRGTDPPHPVRCARAALGEAVAWGAGAVVAKGDLTQAGLTREWRQAARLLSATGLPVIATNGNHDVEDGAAEGAPHLAAVGIELVTGGVGHMDLPGLRVIVVDTTIPGEHFGRLAHAVEAVCDLLADSDRPVMVAMHHYPQQGKRVNIWPPGVPAPEAPEFLEAVASVRTDVLLTSGHTHRHRYHRHGPLVQTEIGATKDFPGTWAGYAVHEGGIRQVVRRVAAPDAISWTDRGRLVLGGVWGLWAAGRLAERCFTLEWR